MAPTSQGLEPPANPARFTGHRLYFASGELTAEDGTLIATAQGSIKRSRAY
jgi:hypothetical protein